MKTFRILPLFGVCALLASSVWAAEDGKGQSEAQEEIMEALAAFFIEHIEVIAPLAVPSEEKQRLSNDFMRKVLPPILKLLSEEEGKTLVGHLEAVSKSDEERLAIYNSMITLREQIMGETDPAKEADMRERMQFYIARLEEAFEEDIRVSGLMSGLNGLQMEQLMVNPLVVAGRAVYEAGVIQPFRQFT